MAATLPADTSNDGPGHKESKHCMHSFLYTLSSMVSSPSFDSGSCVILVTLKFEPTGTLTMLMMRCLLSGGQRACATMMRCLLSGDQIACATMPN